MGNIIKIITTYLTNPDAFSRLLKGTLGKVLSRSYSQNLITSFNPFKAIKYFIDPVRLDKILSKAKVEELQQIMRDIDAVNKEMANKIIKDLNINEIRGLSSSWIVKGHYKSYPNSTIGNLTIWIKNKFGSKPYTYPNVDKTIWFKMQEAKGQNGTGAGSVFWKYFLHTWIHSALRDFIRNNLSKFDKADLTNAQEVVKKLNYGYARKTRDNGTQTRGSYNTARKLQQGRNKGKLERNKITGEYKKYATKLKEPYKREIKEIRTNTIKVKVQKAKRVKSKVIKVIKPRRR